MNLENSFYLLTQKARLIFKITCFFNLLFICNMIELAAGDSLPFVHSLFTDHMVLQRDLSCPVFGWSTPGDVVTVSFAGQKKQAKADQTGFWEAKLDPMPANAKGQELIVTGESSKKQVKLNDVLMGDIWLCSGQSNMEFGLMGANQWWNELPSSPIDGIRLFWVQPSSSFNEAVDVIASKWQVATRESLQKIKSPYTSVAFSAIAWFYGRKLHKETGIPIGLIESSQGNTAIQPWSSVKSLRTQGKNDPGMTSLSGYEKLLDEWAESSDPAWLESKQWISPEYNDKDWQNIEIPKDLSTTVNPPFNGIIWFRRHIDLPSGWDKGSLTLNFGALNDQTAVWFNGHFIGAQDKTRKGVNKKEIEHTFTVPAEIVKAGDNVISVRVLGKEGLAGKPAQIYLKQTGTPKVLPLTGKWSYCMSTPVNKLQKRRTQPLRIWAPGSLYNGMIVPLAPFAIKGVIWYQGEGNAGQAAYGQYLTDMIRDWRALFQVGDFPFYIVQLSGFGKLLAQPGDSSWAITRELQAKVAKDVPNCGLAVSIDRGEIYDIHPPNKRDVGERLVLVALAKTYKKDVVCEGPTYKSMKIEQGHAKLEFDHAKGLKSIGSAPSGFAICGKNGKWVWANAKIENETVNVWHPEVKDPVSVRYGWGDNIICNLYNSADLPAVPFRTDCK